MDEFYQYLDEELKDSVLTSQKALKSNSERFWSACSAEYEKLSQRINNEELTQAFSLVINEILLLQMHSLLVAMDGGAWISEKYRFDIVDKESESIVNEKISLHEEFFDYLWEKRSGDPSREI